MIVQYAHEIQIIQPRNSKRLHWMAILFHPDKNDGYAVIICTE